MLAGVFNRPHHSAVFIRPSDNVSFIVSDRAVFVNIANNITAFILRQTLFITDLPYYIAVFVNDIAVGVNFADNIAVKVANRTVFIYIADYITVLIIGQTFFGTDFTDCFGYHFIADNITVFINIADDIPVIAHNARVVNKPDNVAVFIQSQIMPLVADLADYFAVNINHIAVFIHFTNDVAVKIPHNTVFVNITDNIAVFIINHLRG